MCETALFVSHRRAEAAATIINRINSTAVVSTHIKKQRGQIMGYEVRVRRNDVNETVTEDQVKRWNL